MNEMITAFGVGLLAMTSPCVLPLYPGFLAYLSGGQEALGKSRARFLLGFLVLAGVLTMMLALGALIALLSVSIGSAPVPDYPNRGWFDHLVRGALAL